MPILDQSQNFIKRYRFELPATHSRDRDETPDYSKVAREDLIVMIKSLRNTVNKYQDEMQEELEDKLKQARLLNAIEMHLDTVPTTSEGHHQILSLDHATTWLGKYGPEDAQSLILGVNKTNRCITSRRLLELMRHTKLCDTRPACEHVLHARPQAVTPETLLTFRQIALGHPIREVLRTFTDGVQDDKELWDKTDGCLMDFANRDRNITKEEYKEMSFLSAYFHTQLSGEFQTARLSLIKSLQREGHKRKDRKECKDMPQSNFRKAVNLVRVAMDPDPNAGKLSPASSTDGGMAVVPRHKRKSRIPRPSRSRQDSMMKLATAGKSVGMPMMSGAIEGSSVLRTAGANVDRNRTHRRADRARHRNDERPINPAPTRHRVPRAPRDAALREKTVSPVSPHPTGHRNKAVSPTSPATQTYRAQPGPSKLPPACVARDQTDSTTTQWPGPHNTPSAASADSRDKGKGKTVDKGKGKTVDKGKGKEVVHPLTSNPYIHSPTAIPQDWKPAPVTPAPRPRPRRDPPPPRTTSSIYSVNPAKTNAPSQFNPQRLRSSRSRQPTIFAVGIPATGSGFTPSPPTPQAQPLQDSPPLSIPAGVDLGAIAGGLRHNRPQRPDSTASSVHVDLGSMAGGAYVPPRANWRASITPRPLNLDAVRATRGKVPQSLVPTASHLPQPALLTRHQPPLLDRRRLRVRMDDSVITTESNLDAAPFRTDSWSSQVDLPVSPEPAPTRGRSRRSRSHENINHVPYGQPAPPRRRAKNSRFREQINTLIDDSYNPTTNPDPSRSASRNPYNNFGAHMQQL